MRTRALWRHGFERVRAAIEVAVELCRELSDERAYARHLAAHRRTHSPEEWRRFSDARLKAKFARGRCC